MLTMMQRVKSYQCHFYTGFKNFPFCVQLHMTMQGFIVVWLAYTISIQVIGKLVKYDNNQLYNVNRSMFCLFSLQEHHCLVWHLQTNLPQLLSRTFAMQGATFQNRTHFRKERKGCIMEISKR